MIKSVAVLLFFTLICGQNSFADGIVRFVVAIDTEPIRFNPGEYCQQLDLSAFIDSNSTPSIFDVMNSDWRDSYVDDLGNSLRITWFVMTHEAFRHAVNGNQASVYDALLNHKSSIYKYGDEIAWHYHHADWTDIIGDGDSCWNQILTFDGTEYTHGSDVEITECGLNYLLMERGFFPCSFRSGWVWENTDFSKWLEETIPFDFSANPGYKNEPGKDKCRRNVNDWSRAPREVSGYHPGFSDYQKAGLMKRTILRTISFQDRFASHRLRGVINKARQGEDQLICITTHSYNRIREYIDNILPDVLKYCDSQHVSIQFQAASEAAASTEDASGLGRPEIKLNRNGDSLIISVNQDIFQRMPYCVIEYSSGSLARIYPHRTKKREWVVKLNNGSEKKFACAVSSLNGLVAVKRISLQGGK